MFPPQPDRRGRRETAASTAPETTQEDSNANSGERPPAGFTTLPTELQRHIIELACGAIVEEDILPGEPDPNRPRFDRFGMPYTPAIIPGVEPGPDPGMGSYSPPPERTKPVIYTTSPQLDVPTIIKLCLVSHHLYRSLIGTLYANVCVSRPSALLELHRTLSSRPALGRLVRTMHVGPLEAAPDRCEPMWHGAAPRIRGGRRGGDANYLKCGLETPDEKARLPIWYKPDRQWRMEDGLNPRNCQEEAVYAAIRVAAYALNVNPCYVEHDLAGQDIGEDSYEVKIFMIQAALDLYLLQMRRVEERDGLLVRPWSEATAAAEETNQRLHTGKCRSYPPLLVKTPWPSKAAVDAISKGPKPFVITLAQINEHLARRGSTTDRFDHPLIFSRSGVKNFLDEGPGRGEYVGQDPYQLAHEDGFRPLYKDKKYDGDYADLWGVRGLDRGYRREGVVLPPDLSSDIDPTSPTAATLGSLLTMTRAILCTTPSLVNLSLSGFLERAVCGSRSPPGLKALKELSLGPAPPFWYAPMRLHHTALESVEKLRIVGVQLFKSEIADIAGRRGALPNLREVEWTLASKYMWEDHITLSEAVTRLLSRPLSLRIPPPPRSEVGTPDHWEEEEEQGDDVGEDDDTEVDEEEDDAPSDVEATGSPPPPEDSSDGSVRFEIHLCGPDKEELIAAAPSAEIRAAWVQGLPCPDHYLVLVEGRAAMCPRKEERMWKKTPEAWKILHDEGRQWWRDHAKLTWQWG